ncbi:conserved protein, unknown function [Hepatocystis sp. ex Piliocolobus tephrosceles]|nr:conserved protein, unknown function [Hepatocystis sp. ex Piliocolobus tephrosceles]
MVKIGKKFKGFNKELSKVDTYYAKDKEVDTDKNEITKYNKSSIKLKESYEHNENLYLIEQNRKQKIKEKYKNINAYLENNNISTFLILLLYKILMHKPKNVIQFIINELNTLFNNILKQNTYSNFVKSNNIKTSDVITDYINNFNVDISYSLDTHLYTKLNKVGNDTENGADTYKQNNNEILSDNLIKTIPMELVNEELFLGQDLISISNLTDVINFLKIENTNKIYFNNLNKILLNYENSKNKKILKKENIKISDSICIDKAIILTTVFYNNYFYGKSG